MIPGLIPLTYRKYQKVFNHDNHIQNRSNKILANTGTFHHQLSRSLRASKYQNYIIYYIYILYIILYIYILYILYIYIYYCVYIYIYMYNYHIMLYAYYDMSRLSSIAVGPLWWYCISYPLQNVQPMPNKKKA